MGITKGNIKQIGMMVLRSSCRGRVITFGVQGVNASYGEAEMLLREVGVSVVPQNEDNRQLDNLTQFAQGIHQDVLFRMAGFDTVDSIDFYPNENPTFTLDLNCPLPTEMCERYDLVYDGGTAEHCFNAPQVLINAAQLASTGGYVLHNVPLNNWVDHGFYQFSPTLFFDFYEANGFTDLHMQILFSRKGRRQSYIDYKPNTSPRLPYQLGGSAKSMVFFYARKTKPLREVVFPTQGRYHKKFGGEINEEKRPLTAFEKLRRSLLKRTFVQRSKCL